MQEIEIELRENDNIESIVYTLLAAKARGEKAYAMYNGHKLTSDNISMDKAYMQVVGIERGVINTSSIIEDGYKYLFPERFSAWEELVRSDIKTGAYVLEILASLHSGRYIKYTADLLKLFDLSNSEAKKVKNVACSLHERGPWYLEYNDDGLNLGHGKKFESMISDLKNVSMKLARLHPEKAVKLDFEKLGIEGLERKKETIVNDAIERGRKIIYPEKMNLWEIYVRGRGYDKKVLELMESLARGESVAVVDKQLEDYNLSGFGSSLIYNVVLNFSPRGPEFWRYVAYPASDSDKKFVNDVEECNVIFARLHPEFEKINTSSFLKLENYEDLKQSSFSLIDPEKHDDWDLLIKSNPRFVKYPLEIMTALNADVSLYAVDRLLDFMNLDEDVLNFTKLVVGNFSRRGSDFSRYMDYKDQRNRMSADVTSDEEHSSEEVMKKVKK